MMTFTAGFCAFTRQGITLKVEAPWNRESDFDLPALRQIQAHGLSLGATDFSVCVYEHSKDGITRGWGHYMWSVREQTGYAISPPLVPT